jgi:hypothetical protein
MDLLKVTWRGEKLKVFNIVETKPDSRGHAAKTLWLKAGACVTRAEEESDRKFNAEREGK